VAKPSDSIPYPLPKRLFDFSLALALILLLSPLALAVVAAMLGDRLLVPRDRGPLLRRETRISRGRRFELLKFRTLRRDAGGEPRLAEREPANLTWAGRRILKPWYLDELPQLWNVLRGDISFVGPRPWEPKLVEEQLAAGHDYRLHVVAGLTGAAQVTKGSGEWRYTERDLEYVQKSRTLGGWALVRCDLGILRETLRVMARGEGLEY
jgi:lipopolysaccharide/colanic/teichoic acid biosynthesis glycosyltransferase